MKNIFTEHPRNVGETYFEHLYHAFIFGFNMIIGGIACIIHAIFPFLFIKTASNYLFKMTHQFIERMPNMEDRMICLADKLNEKQKQCSESCGA